MDDKIFIRFTDAPESYDYSNTETVCIVGTTSRGINKGAPVRKVRILSEYSLRFQEPRYASGLHLCMTLEQLEESHDLFGYINMALAKD